MYSLAIGLIDDCFVNVGRPNQCSNCPKGGGRSKFFFRWGVVERRGGGSKYFFDTGLKKRWGSNFIINYRRKR